MVIPCLSIVDGPHSGPNVVKLIEETLNFYEAFMKLSFFKLINMLDIS